MEKRFFKMNTTLAYYNKNYEAFISDTLEVDMTNLYQLFEKELLEGSKILDLGCGSGRDSLYFERKGYRVTAVDGSIELCKHARSLVDCEVLHMSFEDITFEDRFDAIWACASLLHIPKVKLPSLFTKLCKSLKSGGVLYCSFKYGDFEGERNGRYFTNMTEISFPLLLVNTPALSISSFAITGDLRNGRTDEKWLNIIIKKR